MGGGAEGLPEGGWVPGDAALCVDNGNSKDDPEDTGPRPW